MNIPHTMNPILRHPRHLFLVVLFLFLLTLAELSSAQKPKPARAVKKQPPVTVAKKPNSPQPGRLAFEFILDTRDTSATCAKVIHVFPNSPAEKGGLSAGMRITEIDHRSILNKTLVQIGGMLSGEAGTNITLHVLVPPLEVAHDIILTRGIYDMDTITGNTGRAKEALSKKDLNNALYWLKKAKGSPEAALLLASIYSGYYLNSSGIAEQPDQPGNHDFIRAIRSISNADSVHAYLDPLVQEGYPKAYSLMSELYNADIVFIPHIKDYGTLSPAPYWLYAAADAGDLFAQENVLYDIFHHLSGFTDDPAMAYYWYKRALLQGSTRGDAILSAIGKMGTPDFRLASLTDIRDMIRVAHQHLGDAQYYYSVSKMNPYGIDGFVNGDYDAYLANFDENALRLTWSTYKTEDRAKAQQIFDFTKALLTEYIRGQDHPTAGEYRLTDYIGMKPEDSYLLSFTATESDGKSYKMELGVTLLMSNKGYYVEMFYQNQDQ